MSNLKSQMKKGAKRSLYFFKGAACAGLTVTTGLAAATLAVCATFLAIGYVGLPLSILLLLVASVLACLSIAASVEMFDAIDRVRYP